MRRATGLRFRSLAGAFLSALIAGPAAAASAHTFVLTYRDFGPVTSASGFIPGDGYSVRFEGCYAKHSDEAICGFTLRASRELTITNIANASHATGADGATKRTCCVFAEGDARGFPIVAGSAAPTGVGVLSRPLRPGESVDLMLRVPDYRRGGPLAGITFSRGGGDAGVSFPAKVTELP